SGGDCVLSQQSSAEAVNCRYPGALDRFTQVSARCEAMNEALLDFGCGFFSESDGKNTAGVNITRFDQPRESFDEDTRFSGAGAGNDARVLAGTLDRFALSLGQNDAPNVCGAADSTRHMSRKSHQTHFLSSLGRAVMSPLPIDSRTCDAV